MLKTHFVLHFVFFCPRTINNIEALVSIAQQCRSNVCLLFQTINIMDGKSIQDDNFTRTKCYSSNLICAEICNSTNWMLFTLLVRCAAHSMRRSKLKEFKIRNQIWILHVIALTIPPDLKNALKFVPHHKLPSSQIDCDCRAIIFRPK